MAASATQLCALRSTVICIEGKEALLWHFQASKRLDETEFKKMGVEMQEEVIVL